MCARLSAWLSELPAAPERRVIAVSHGVTGRVLRGLYAGLRQKAIPHEEAFRTVLARVLVSPSFLFHL